MLDDSETILDQYNHNFDFEGFHTNIDDEEMDNDNPDPWVPSNDEERQGALSQKLSQLSTAEAHSQHEKQTQGTKRSYSSGTPSTPTAAAAKKNRTDGETIPEYLQLDQRLFQERIVSLITEWNLSMTVDEIQSIAVLKHRVASASLEHQLWTAYLAVGTGQSSVYGSGTETKVDQRFWTTCVIEKQQASSPTVLNDARVLQQSYETITRQQLADLMSSIEQHEEALQAWIDNGIDLPADAEKTIDRYVEDYGIRPLRMRTSYLLKKLEFDRDIEIQERECQQRQPTEYQVT